MNTIGLAGAELWPLYNTECCQGYGCSIMATTIRPSFLDAKVCESSTASPQEQERICQANANSQITCPAASLPATTCNQDPAVCLTCAFMLLWDVLVLACTSSPKPSPEKFSLATLFLALMSVVSSRPVPFASCRQPVLQANAKCDCMRQKGATNCSSKSRAMLTIRGFEISSGKSA